MITRRAMFTAVGAGLTAFLAGRVLLPARQRNGCPNCGLGKHLKKLQYGCDLRHTMPPQPPSGEPEDEDPPYVRETVFIQYGVPLGDVPGWRCDKCKLEWSGPDPVTENPIRRFWQRLFG